MKKKNRGITSNNSKMSDKNSISKQSSLLKVTKDANISEVVWKYPVAAEIMLDYGLHCVGCVASDFDTIEMGAKLHGMEDDEIDEMVARINEAVEFGE